MAEQQPWADTLLYVKPEPATRYALRVRAGTLDDTSWLRPADFSGPAARSPGFYLGAKRLTASGLQGAVWSTGPAANPCADLGQRKRRLRRVGTPACIATLAVEVAWGTDNPLGARDRGCTARCCGPASHARSRRLRVTRCGTVLTAALVIVNT